MDSLKYILIIFLYGITVSCNQTKTEITDYNTISKTRVNADSINKPIRYTENEVFDKSTFKPIRRAETLILNYNAISCTCAQWSDSRFDKKQNPDQKNYYWLEPADEKLLAADNVFKGDNLPVQIKVTGQIISEKGFPKGKRLSKVSQNEAGKVFRYTEIEILKN